MLCILQLYMTLLLTQKKKGCIWDSNTEAEAIQVLLVCYVIKTI